MTVSHIINSQCSCPKLDLEITVEAESHKMNGLHWLTLKNVSYFIETALLTLCGEKKNL